MTLVQRFLFYGNSEVLITQFSHDPAELSTGWSRISQWKWWKFGRCNHGIQSVIFQRSIREQDAERKHKECNHPLAENTELHNLFSSTTLHKTKKEIRWPFQGHRKFTDVTPAVGCIAWFPHQLGCGFTLGLSLSVAKHHWSAWIQIRDKWTSEWRIFRHELTL